MIMISGLEKGAPLPDHVKAFMEHEKYVVVSKSNEEGEIVLRLLKASSFEKKSKAI